MSFDGEVLNSFITRIYDAALDDALWPGLVRSLAKAVNAEESLMFSPRLSAEQPYYFLSPHQHIDPAHWAVYEAYFWQHDVWAIESFRQGLIGNGRIVHGDRLIPRNELRKTEIYNDMYKPHMLGIDVVMGACVFDQVNQTQAVPVFLNFFRTANAPAFNETEEIFIRLLLPHLQRALAIRRRLTNEQHLRQIHADVLAQIGAGIMLLDGVGRVLMINPKAENLLLTNAALGVLNGRLYCKDTVQNNYLRQAIKQAKNCIGSVIRLENPGNHNCLIMTLSPLSPEKAEMLRINAAILVLLTQPDQFQEVDLKKFATLYKLTSAETRVLKQLLANKSTQEIAAEYAVTMNTLRSQMKALFAKTNTRTQRELVSFCLGHLKIG